MCQGSTLTECSEPNTCYIQWNGNFAQEFATVKQTLFTDQTHLSTVTPGNSLLNLSSNLSGTLILVNLLHRENGSFPISFTVSGIVTSEIPQSENAPSPIYTTLEGIEAFFKL